MGRSRAVSKSVPTDGDHSHRSKRRKTVSSLEPQTHSGRGGGGGGGGGENGQGHVGKVALYHCNYCNKDISGAVRIKCAVCPDFDLCLECFSVGAEVTPHRCVHPYRVMDNLCFPIISPDWNADEEILLLEGIEMYGFGNWNEVADHVGTKMKSQCIDHYNSVYMNSPCFPFPDLSHVMGKSRHELLAMAAPTLPAKQENSASGEFKLKEESTLPARINTEMPKKANVADKSSSLLKEEYDMHAGSSSSDATIVATKKLSNIGEMKDGIKLQESQADRSIGGKKPKVSGEEGPSMLESSGYNPKRQEFEIEYDNDAEHMLADMEFKNTDTDFEHEVKLRVLRIYYKRLDERKRRKDFIMDRNLLYPDPFEKNLLPDEKEMYQRFKVFMRYHSKEEHEGFMRSIIEEHRIVRRIQELKEARAAGCQTSAEANKFIEEKRKREAEEGGLQRARENVQAGKVLQRPHHVRVEVGGSPSGAALKGAGALSGNQDLSSPTGYVAAPSCLDNWDITGFIGADLLSGYEKALCSEMRILPAHYLKMMESLSVAIMKGMITKKCEAHRLFKVDPVKVDKLYDILVDKGIARQPS